MATWVAREGSIRAVMDGADEQTLHALESVGKHYPLQFRTSLQAEEAPLNTPIVMIMAKYPTNLGNYEVYDDDEWFTYVS